MKMYFVKHNFLTFMEGKVCSRKQTIILCFMSIYGSMPSLKEKAPYEAMVLNSQYFGVLAIALSIYTLNL